MARKKKQPESKEPEEAGPSASDGLPLEERLPPHKLYPLTEPEMSSFFEIDAIAVEQEKLSQIANLLWCPIGLSREASDARILRALDLFESIKPADGLEAMLAVQMVGAHEAATECLRRAMLADQTFEGRNVNLAHAQKMMGLYTRQLAALDKHRGKGQQKVTVEHVHVESGGQAIVGHVDAAAQKPSGKSSEGSGSPLPPPALEAPGQPPPSLLEQPELRPARRR